MNKLEEQQFAELKKLGQALGVPIVETFWQLEVRDKTGRVIQRHRQRSHSWTRNAYNLMFCQLASKDGDDATDFEGGKLNIKNTGGTVRSASQPISVVSPATNVELHEADVVGYGYLAGAGIDTFGTLVGTGTDAESFEDYELQTKIASGSGAGELAYGAHVAHAETYTAGTKTYKVDLHRYFNNNSGSTIGVNELGLAANGHAPGSNNSKFLVARDKLGTVVNIPDTGQLKVTYTVSLVFAG